MISEPEHRPEYGTAGPEPDRERYRPAGQPAPFERGTDGPRVVLAGVDGSLTSMRALAYAAGLARRQGSELIVVFVAAPLVLASMVPGSATGQIQDTLEELGAELREQVTRGMAEIDVRLTFLIRRGAPYAELRAAADELRADMVVVGASTQAGHRLVGSIATRLVRAGHWPVAVVP